MAQFQAFAKGVSVNGQTVLSLVDGMGAFKATALQILEVHGIGRPQAAGWYPQQAWLDAFEEIFRKIGVSTLYQIGMSIPKNAKFPASIDGIEAALGALDGAYHLNHRGGEIGHYTFTKTGPRQGVVVCRNPYPCDFDRGIIEAMANRFKPEGARLRVQHDHAKPCRKSQADSCTYTVAW